MFPKTMRWLLLSVLIIFFVSGCECTPEQIEAFIVIPDGPADGAVVDKDPLFSWHENQSCTPERFQISISHDFTVNKGGSSRYPAGDMTEFIWPYSLTIGGRYSWLMKAYQGSPPADTGPSTGWREFYVGPLCSGEAMAAPRLDYPENHSWMSESGPQRFTWAYEGGNCLPPNYEYEFASDSNFSTIVDSGMTPDYMQHIDRDFPNCSTLFWRVRAVAGTITSPWSDPYDFHRVTDDTCWQTHYQSDEFGRIAVRLYEDVCSQTGMQTPLGVKLMPGCYVPDGGTVVSGDGRKTSLDHWMSRYAVSVGGGPCPSTGQQYRRLKADDNFVHVLTPGTYCVSISRNWVADNQGTDVSLLRGTWTDPRTYDILAMKTVVMDSGFQDAEVLFGWDWIEKFFITFPLEKVKKCYLGPEPQCPIVEFTEADSVIPIFARDQISEWLLTEVRGTPCYVKLEPSLLEEYEMDVDEDGFKFADLEMFPQPAPCPKPEPIPSGRVNCPAITDETQCLNTAGCDWVFGAGPISCVNK